MAAWARVFPNHQLSTRNYIFVIKRVLSQSIDGKLWTERYDCGKKNIAQIHVEVFGCGEGEEVSHYDRFDELHRKSIEV